MKNKNQLSQKEAELNALLKSLMSDKRQLTNREIAGAYNDMAASYGLNVLSIAAIGRIRQNTVDEIMLPAEITAKVAGVSASLVKGVRSGERNATKGKGLRAAIADDLLKTGFKALISEVSRMVKFK
nr:hypothetical protein [Mucilaginibacter sp. L294]